MPPLRSTLALVYLGLMPTALATLIMVHVIRSAGPTFLTQTNYQVPVWSVLFGVLILSEPLPPQFLAALGLILTGLAVSRVSWRRRRAPV
ncbi:EamA family transporter [Pararhodobacter zhoushanensis]|uniref:EamA family transporter n=1 Tax=Pararhodobacter zhoushanensis TaxID=2479545 RepID=A0ABT3H453_9RHOB|nr:EamA family transporter [Pararhodobacter zhoushanensis]MCW1934470.1 EamA family transporter [Pararhodobacter zhoushanensis]